MIDRLAKIQLSIFAVITVITLSVMAIFYLRLPATFGIGTYGVSADFVAGGGLYKNANVTYRGVAVGRVESVGLNPNGVTAHMRLNSGTAIPSNVTATVRSVSAIGEQYIDLVPPENPSSTKLRNGFRIQRQNTRIGQDVADLLRQAETLLGSLGDTRLRELLHEAFIATNGAGPELARLIESARLLVDEANANYPQVSQLIDQAGPFLQAQIRAGGDIKSLADGLARFTWQLRAADPRLRDTLADAPDAIDEANTAFSGIRPSFPALAASLANLGRVGVIYHKSIEQLLVVFPALFAAIITSAGGVPQDEGAKLDFKIDLHDPPPCMTGFLPPPLVRSPADESVREIPRDMYCKTAQNDPSTVRGARNYPCQEFPGKRAPTVQLCRDPRGYVPVGTNPWRGPPIPYGTEVTDGRNILPPNKFPYIPPGADPDPGVPIVGPGRRHWYLRARDDGRIQRRELGGSHARSEAAVVAADTGVAGGQQSTTRRARRKASRPAGPAEGESSRPAQGAATVRAAARTESKPAKAAKPALRPVKPPPRRPAHRVLVGWLSLAAGLLAIAALAWGVTALVMQNRDADARQARNQRFVDAATQTVVNMFSYTPDTIDESVNRFVNGTSGPLRGMLNANNNVDNLKGLFRATNATSEAVVNGAALEGIDEISDNASVLVSVRVTVADIDGVNKPSMPYRLRVIVHEDENGRMTGYDLKYPDGGN
ncbi:MCE-family protein MCE4F [Mycobacterium tuberculosis]|nr:MCE-family protein MCE4F [Mycobacterium tuberculosis]